MLIPGQLAPCRFCGTMMPWDAACGFWQCPNPACHAAQFPPEPNEEPKPRPEEPETPFPTIRELWADEQSYKRSISKPGGSKQAGRKRAPKKPSKRRREADLRLGIDK